MVAYSFQPRFVPHIRNGSKGQTIRKIGKRRHARPGEAMQLYCGMRTAHCFKILEHDPICQRVDDVLFDLTHPRTPILIVAGIDVRVRTARDRYAQRDGFFDFTDMLEFWLEEHGPNRFRGRAHVWAP